MARISTSPIAALSTPAVSRITAVPPSTLHSWMNKKVVWPSIRDSSGKRATCWWAFRDVVVVRTVKALREAGCPMQTIMKVRKILNQEKDGFEGKILSWTGSDIEIVESWGEVRSTVKHPGQLVFRLIAIPLADVQKEVIRVAGDDVKHVVPSHLHSLTEMRHSRFLVVAK